MFVISVAKSAMFLFRLCVTGATTTQFCVDSQLSIQSTISEVKKHCEHFNPTNINQPRIAQLNVLPY